MKGTDTVNNLRCSKMLAIGSGIVLVIMGIISLAVSIWMLSANNWAVIFSYQINLMCTFMIVAACIMILGGAYGVWAAYASNNTHLSGFYGVQIVVALLLLVCGVLALALPLRVIVAGCGAPIYPVVAGLNVTATQAIATICQSCQCYYNQTGQDMAGYSINTTNTSAPTRAQNCTGWNKTAYDDLLQNLQTSFSCAGWCPGTKGKIYLMNNVNIGVPGSACFEATTNWFRSFCKTIGICAFLFAAIIVLLIISVWWHLCELVDFETERILLLTGKLPQPPMLGRADSFEITQINLPGVQQVSQVSQPSSPGRQLFQPYPSAGISTQNNMFPQMYQQNGYPTQQGYPLQPASYGGSPR